MMFVPVTIKERETLAQFVHRCGSGHWEVIVERAYNKRRWEVWLYRSGIPIIQVGLYMIKLFAVRKANKLGRELDKVEASMIEETWVSIGPEDFVKMVYGQPPPPRSLKNNVIPFRQKVRP